LCDDKYNYQVGQEKTGPVLKVCNSFIWWRRNSIYIS